MTNPYMVIKNDKEMMVNALLKSVKTKMNSSRHHKTRSMNLSTGTLKKSLYLEGTPGLSSNKQASKMKTSLMTNVS